MPCRPDLKVETSPTAATSAVAVNAPMPGMACTAKICWFCLRSENLAQREQKIHATLKGSVKVDLIHVS